MMETDIWLVPVLDGQPRIEKPPLLPWLTRLSFQIFGVSLTAARLIIVLFSGLLIAVIGAISLKLTNDRRHALLAALIAASTIGIAIHGRILLADIPAAALSALAFYSFLHWSTGGLPTYLVLAAVTLAVSFLAKGPVAFVVFGSGGLALVLTDATVRRRIWSNLSQFALPVAIFFVLSGSWYAYVFMQFPDYTLQVLETEYEARRAGRFNVHSIAQFAALFFPWTLLLIVATIRRSSVRGWASNRQISMLFLWAGFSLVPFFFIRSFDRYVVGTLIPASLFCAYAVQTLRSRLGARLAVLIAGLGILPLVAFCYWFRAADYSAMAAVIILFTIFALVWWTADSHWAMALMSAALWNAIFGILFPHFGVNAIPSELLTLTKEKTVVFFQHPQPALLPMLEHRSGRLIMDLSHATQHCAQQPLLFGLQTELGKLARAASKTALDIHEIYRYRTILAFEKLVASAFKESTAEQWRSAVLTRSLEPLMTEIVLFRIVCDQNQTRRGS